MLALHATEALLHLWGTCAPPPACICTAKPAGHLQMAAVRGLQQPKPFDAGDLVVLGGCSVEVKLYRPR